MSVGTTPAWLVARPVAHRGLHDRQAGRIENSLSAARAAVTRGFAIECDVQRSTDGEAMVFHDFDLERLTGASGALIDLTRRNAEALTLLGSSDQVPSLPVFLTTINGAVPLVCEIKSRFDGDMRLADRVVEIVRAYAGPIAIKSFDPDVLLHLRASSIEAPLGIVAQAHYDDPEWSGLSDECRRRLGQALHFGDTRPDFLSYHVGDLPHAVPYLCRTMLRLPVMAWTVRARPQWHAAAPWADQMVFEGFVP